MDKISVKVCIGSSCYAEGREILKRLHEIAPERYGDRVELVTCQCLGLCSIKLENSNAPYVKVDDYVIEGATVEKVLEYLDKVV